MSEQEFPPPTPDQAVGYGQPQQSYRPDIDPLNVPAPRLGKAAWWCGVFSIVLGSIGLGIAGLLMGQRALSYGNPRGKRARLLSIIGIAESILLLAVFGISTH